MLHKNTILSKYPIGRIFGQTLQLSSAFFGLLLCCVLFFAGFAQAKNAEQQRPATMPVVTSQMKQKAAQPAAAPSQASRSSASSPSVKGATKKVAKKTKGAPGFSTNPFALENREPGARKKAAGIPGNPAQYVAKPQSGNGMVLGDSGKVRLSGSAYVPSGDRLVPQERAVFSGSTHTMPYMDDETPPEVTMTYKARKGTSARVAVNSQDENSPLYTAATKEGNINSTGVFLDVDVKENLQLELGGEVRNVESPTMNDSGESAHGASVGLRWSF